MSDREKVINDLQMQIEDLEERLAIVLEGQPEIVMCKNCKHGEKSPTFRYYPEITWCSKYLKAHNDEWYCADGERR